MKGPLYQSIEKKIQDAIKPAFLEILDESSQHAGHAGVKDAPSPETHFHVTVVSDEFNGKSPVIRHRTIYKLLDDEFKQGLHALRLKTLTQTEFQKE